MAYKPSKYKSRSKRKFRKNLKRRTMKPMKSIVNQTHYFKRVGQTITIGDAGFAALGYLRLNSGGRCMSLLDSTSVQRYDGNWQCTADIPSFTNYVGTSLGFNFSLDRVQGGSLEFRNMFDKYKILGIKLKILYQHNVSDVQGASILPILRYAYCDAENDLDSLDQIKQRGTVRSIVLNQNKPQSIYIKNPKAFVDTDGLTTTNPPVSTTNRGLNGNQWLSTEFGSDTLHGGLKAFLSNFYTTGSATHMHQITIEPTYYIACKYTK